MPYSAYNRTRGRQASRRGASLIEVLVALVLLVVGIYSVARLFPGGFSAIRASQNSEFADRLAQSQMELLKQNDQFLLDAVYMYAPNGGILTSYPDQYGNPLNPVTDYNNDYPNYQNPDPAYDDINKMRYISGEQFTVPAANTNVANPATNGVSLHVLNYGPIVMPSPVITSSSAPANVRGLPPVHTGPWTPKLGIATPGNNDPATYNLTPGGGDLPGDLLGSGGSVYAIDYTDQEIALPPAPYERFFTLALKQLVTGSGYSEILTYYIPLAIPPASTDNSTVDTQSNYNGGWFDPMPSQGSVVYLDSSRSTITDQPFPVGGTLAGWITNSASLTCMLTQVQSIPALRSNISPYTYAFYSSDPNLSKVNLGVIAFNPQLAGQDVSVSYLTYNWHVIHEDDTVPTSPDTPLHLTIDHLKRAGTVQSDQSIYSGMFGGDVPTAGQYDIVLLDTDTGQSIGLNVANDAVANGAVYDLDNQSGPTANNQPDPGSFRVSYQNGTILLPTGAGNAATGAWASVPHTHLRVFYEGDYDWAVALQKGPSIYTLGTRSVSNYTSAGLGAGQYGLNQGSGVALLIFPISDVGQTVELDDVRYTDTNGNSQVVGSVTGTIATGLQDQGNDFVDIDQYLPNVNTNAPILIGAVRGVSARAVVLWKERGQWKSLTQSTILGNGQ